MTSVTKDNIRKFLIEKVLVAIREKLPRTSHRNTIKIQQDNARPHIHSTNPLFKEASEKLGLNIEIVNQPPNSPDLNVLDLGYFNPFNIKKAPRNVDELIEAVSDSFEELQRSTLNNIFH